MADQKTLPMKTLTSFTTNNTFFATPVTALLTIVFVLSATSAEAKVERPGPKSDSIVVKKMQVSKKCTIRIYPNATHEVLFFSVTGGESKVYDLFIFDMDGKLVKRTQVRNRETTILKSFGKGSYFFEVFSNDERIENGNMIIN
jgi:hypothetical protein